MSTLKRLSAALLAIALCAAAALTIPACNTVKGAGEDLKAAGEAGDEAITGDRDD